MGIDNMEISHRFCHVCDGQQFSSVFFNNFEPCHGIFVPVHSSHETASLDNKVPHNLEQVSYDIGLLRINKVVGRHEKGVEVGESKSLGYRY